VPTTWVFKNLHRRGPNRQTVLSLHEELSSIISSRMYNLLFMPSALTKGKGYAIINFTTSTTADEALRRLHAQSWPSNPGDAGKSKIKIVPGRIQGFQETLLQVLSKENLEDQQRQEQSLLVLRDGFIIDLPIALQFQALSRSTPSTPSSGSRTRDPQVPRRNWAERRNSSAAPFEAPFASRQLRPPLATSTSSSEDVRTIRTESPATAAGSATSSRYPRLADIIERYGLPTAPGPTTHVDLQQLGFHDGAVWHL